jgi:hypothetical protein
MGHIGEAVMTQHADGHSLKVEGQDLVEGHNRYFMETMREEAKRISHEVGHVTSDDLRIYAGARGIEPTHPNCWGAIFRVPSWRVVGRTKSYISSNHTREIRIWKYIGH